MTSSSAILVNALRRSHLTLAAALLLAAPLGGCSTLDSIFGDATPDAPKVEGSVPPVEELYNNGVDALNTDRYDLAVKQFDSVEQNYPYSSWAVNAQEMEGYTEYKRGHYADAIPVLDRYIQLHPASRDIAYVYYVRALSYYEQIADIQRDQQGTNDALSALQDVVNRFPDTPYARDARLKIDLARDHLAGKEMEIGRYYEQQHLYAAAIGRYQHVVDDYQTTNHVPEALHRLTEVYLFLGMTDQAKRTASVLGYNYPGSEWYQQSYSQLAGDGLAQPADSAGTTKAAGQPGFLSRTFGSLF